MELARKLAISSINRFDPERAEALRQAALADFDDNRTGVPPQRSDPRSDRKYQF